MGCLIVVLLFLIIGGISTLGPYGILIGILSVVLFICFYLDFKKKNEETTKTRHMHHLEIMNGKTQDFYPTASIVKDFSDYAFYVDENGKKIMIAQLLSNIKKIYNFNEIIECSIIEDNTTTVSSSAGNAFVGGVLGGTTGAIIGSSTKKSEPVVLSLSVRLITKNIGNSLCDIPIITSQMRRATEDYKKRFQFAQELYATITSIINAAKIS